MSPLEGTAASCYLLLCHTDQIRHTAGWDSQLSTTVHTTSERLRSVLSYPNSQHPFSEDNSNTEYKQRAGPSTMGKLAKLALISLIVSTQQHFVSVDALRASLCPLYVDALFASH